MGERKVPYFGGRRLSRAQHMYLGLSLCLYPASFQSKKELSIFILANDIIVSSDASITIAFGVFGAIISLISLIIGYLTLRATTVAKGKINLSYFCFLRSIS
jgi:hypothetical protein